MLRRELGAAEVAGELDVQNAEFRRGCRTLRLASGEAATVAVAKTTSAKPKIDGRFMR